MGKGYEGEGCCEMAERRDRTCCSKALESVGNKPGEPELECGIAAIMEGREAEWSLLFGMTR